MNENFEEDHFKKKKKFGSLKNELYQMQYKPILICNKLSLQILVKKKLMGTPKFQKFVDENV